MFFVYQQTICVGARISVIALSLVSSFHVISFLCLAAYVHVMFICILYMFGSRIIYLVSSSFSFCICLVWICFSFTVPLWFLGSSHLSWKFPCLFRFAVFLHSSCSVVVSYFMFIPVFVILLCSVTVFNLRLGGIKLLWQDFDMCNKRMQHYS